MQIGSDTMRGHGRTRIASMSSVGRRPCLLRHLATYDWARRPRSLFAAHPFKPSLVSVQRDGARVRTLWAASAVDSVPVEVAESSQQQLLDVALCKIRQALRLDTDTRRLHEVCIQRRIAFALTSAPPAHLHCCMANVRHAGQSQRPREASGHRHHVVAEIQA
jgi:hypothetical protein